MPPDVRRVAIWGLMGATRLLLAAAATTAALATRLTPDPAGSWRCRCGEVYPPPTPRTCFACGVPTRNEGAGYAGNGRAR